MSMKLEDRTVTAGDSTDTARLRQRIRSIDIIRGAVMVLMALDHVRVYFSNATFDPTDLSQTTAALFFTRWITHFCAPAFVFLAGTAAFLHGQRLQSRAGLSRFLLTRGLWLVLIELTLVRLAWTFNFDYAHYMLAGIIWMIGWCMVLMAGLVRLPVAVTGLFGVLVVAGHNLIDPRLGAIRQALQGKGSAWIWQILYFGGPIEVFGSRLIVLYSIVPWIGVMAAGYAFGAVMRMPVESRRRICLRIGFAAILAFLVLRGFNLYGNPWPWTAQRSLLFDALAIVNTTKYPASFAFLLMTLGPTIALIPLLERASGRLANVLDVYGRVPFFYYVLHVPLIHLIALLVSTLRYGRILPWMFGNHPMMAAPPPPDGYGYGVPVIWIVTLGIVSFLYLPCRWFGELKKRRTEWWLSLL
jgi:uncharacterized membrane protein